MGVKKDKTPLPPDSALPLPLSKTCAKLTEKEKTRKNETKRAGLWLAAK